MQTFSVDAHLSNWLKKIINELNFQINDPHAPIDESYENARFPFAWIYNLKKKIKNLVAFKCYVVSTKSEITVKLN